MNNLKGGGTGYYNITILNKQWMQTLKPAAVIEEAKPQYTVDPRLSEPMWPTAAKNSFG